MLSAMPTDTEPLAGRDYGDTLWTPDAATIDQARITHYARWLAAERNVLTEGYEQLWRWSVAEPGPFWASICGLFRRPRRARGDGPWLTGGQMPDVTWFAGTTLNYARNMLRHAYSAPERTAVIYDSEAGRAGRISYAELERQVARVQAGLAALGVGRGDRVAAYLTNCPEALVSLLATACLGAIWTACSPDFGATSVIDRFAQIAPKVLIAVDGYAYGGRRFDRRAEVSSIAAALPGLEALVTVDYLGAGQPDDIGARRLGWPELADLGGAPSGPLTFDEVPFDHPLWVLYSSGTTGLPKPIVHGHGGIVLEHLKALCLHQDIGPGATFFWYTTTGWMMWNYLAGGLLAGTTIVLYDGSAVYPGTDATLWRLAASTGVTYAGTGAPCTCWPA